MRRRLLNLLTVLWLLLCATLVVVVVYSFWMEHRFDGGRREYAGNRSMEVRWSVSLGWGEVEIERRSFTVTHVSEQHVTQLAARRPVATAFYHRARRASAPAPRFGTVWRRLGFFWYRVSGSYPFPQVPATTPTGRVDYDELKAATPAWPALLCALPPGFWLIRRVRRLRARRNVP